MCGISGFFGSNLKSPRKQSIINTLNLMKNRGTDDNGVFEYDVNRNYKVVFNHSRLSIIDPNPNSSQPFVDEGGMLVFNGMIYNYLEIKKDLKKKKIKFITNSDTEVLLKFLNYYGENKISQLDGMWSFAYYNFKKKKLVLSRDSFGEKPLFYNLKKNSLYFGSSLNYISSLSSRKFKINYNKFENYLKFGFRTLCNDNETFFKEIISLDPGCNLILDDKLKFKKKEYWAPKKITIKNSLNYQKEKKNLTKTFKNVLKKRLRSDFPMACLLSGGIDSSSIVSEASKMSNKNIHCFSVKPKDKDYDEDKYIQTIVKRKNIKHKYVNIKKDNNKNLLHLKNVIQSTGNIVPTSTYLIFSLLCKKIKSEKFKVLLTGYGGDEMFAGFYIHQLHYLYSLKKNSSIFKKKYFEWKKFVKPLLRNEYLRNYEKYKENMKNKEDVMFYDFMGMKQFFKNFKFKNKKRLVPSFSDHLKDCLYKDMRYYSLPGQIAAVDNIAMHHGIENRTPFLSQDIFKKTFSYPNHFLINKGYGKFIFRDILRNKIDSTILKNRNKVGFFMNIQHLLDLESKDLRNIIFSNKFIKSIIDIKMLKILLDKKNKNNQESHFIFAILNTIFFINKFE
jgi:asparagine synthase (glutamine-hydrolysing)